MPNWSEISKNNFDAAKQMLDDYPRSSVSRAYYAAFAALTDVVLKSKKVRLPQERETPSHRKLPGYLSQIYVQNGKLKQIKQYIRLLYSLRLVADYDSKTRVDKLVARDAVRFASAILLESGVK